MSVGHPVREKNLQKIISAVGDLRRNNFSSVSWSQIKSQIEQNASDDIDSDYSYQLSTLDSADRKRMIKKQCMSDEALSKNLKILIQKRVLEKKDGLYSFTDGVLADVRHFAPLFGRSALSGVLRFHTSATTENPVPTTAEDLPEFIKRFGMLLLFILIEGSRKLKDDTLTNKEKDNLAMEWVQNAVPVRQMLDVFQAVYGPKDKRYHDGTEPTREIPDYTLDMLQRGLKQLNPEVYKELLDVFADYMGEPKERSLRKNSNKPGVFIYPRD
jgi:hypothetical protein